MYVAEWSEKSFGEAMIPESRTNISSGTITGSRRAVFLVGRVITLCREFMSITSLRFFLLLFKRSSLRSPTRMIFSEDSRAISIFLWRDSKKWTSEVRGL